MHPKFTTSIHTSQGLLIEDFGNPNCGHPEIGRRGKSNLQLSGGN